jgi:cellulose synthase/poly-beta-1,6-N-acetylglucosamine synthase-like glycosyltransferase
MPERPAVAVIIPCYNEELTITTVVREFRAELPDAHIYVFDNNSTDRTVEVARQPGARIAFEKRQGAPLSGIRSAMADLEGGAEQTGQIKAWKRRLWGGGEMNREDCYLLRVTTTLSNSFLSA